MNPYKVLGLEESASLDEIKKRYRKLSFEHHPDRGGQAEEFRKIADAYALLDSEIKIKTYHSRRNGLFTWDKDLEDYFGDIFGSKGAPARRTIYADVYISIQESFQGMTKPLFYKEIKTCRMCGGLGASLFDAQGNIKKTCEDCLGQGSVHQTHETVVHIPRSVTEGAHISTEAEDVIASIHILPHEEFNRKGFDVQSDLQVSLRDIFSGNKIKIKTLHGEVEFELPRCIQPEKIVRIKKKGFFDVRRNNFGDHLLKIKLVIPDYSSEDCDKIVRCLDGIQKSAA